MTNLVTKFLSLANAASDPMSLVVLLHQHLAFAASAFHALRPALMKFTHRSRANSSNLANFLNVAFIKALITIFRVSTKAHWRSKCDAADCSQQLSGIPTQTAAVLARSAFRYVLVP